MVVIIPNLVRILLTLTSLLHPLIYLYLLLYRGCGDLYHIGENLFHWIFLQYKLAGLNYWRNFYPANFSHNILYGSTCLSFTLVLDSLLHCSWVPGNVINNVTDTIPLCANVVPCMSHLLLCTHYIDAQLMHCLLYMKLRVWNCGISCIKLLQVVVHELLDIS